MEGQRFLVGGTLATWAEKGWPPAHTHVSNTLQNGELQRAKKKIKKSFVVAARPFLKKTVSLAPVSHPSFLLLTTSTPILFHRILGRHPPDEPRGLDFVQSFSHYFLRSAVLRNSFPWNCPAPSIAGAKSFRVDPSIVSVGFVR